MSIQLLFQRFRLQASIAGVALLLAIALIQAGPAFGQDASPEASPGAMVADERLLQPEIGLIEAQQIALEGQADDVMVRTVELEREDRGLVWEIELSNRTEVEVDASTGEVIDTEEGVEEEDEDDENEGDDQDDDQS